jgi:recombination protein RecA
MHLGEDMANMTFASNAWASSTVNAPLDLTSGLAALPRGAITEILGSASNGRTALATMMLATATKGAEISAWVDCADTFDPASAEAAGADLGKLLWVQCGHRTEVALKAADMIVHSGGFGLVVVDLCDAPATALQRIPLSYWYRIRRAVEHTPSVLLILGSDSVARACAVRQFTLERARFEWRGLPPFQTITRLETHAVSRKPMGAAASQLEAFSEVSQAI